MRRTKNIAAKTSPLDDGKASLDMSPVCAMKSRDGECGMMKGTVRWDGRPVIFQHVIRSTAHCTHSILVVRYV